MADTGGVNWPALLSPGQVIANLPTDYYKSLENNSNQNLREAFQNGIPTNPDGSINFDQAGRRLLQLGGAGQVGNAVQLSNVDQARQQLALGQRMAEAIGNMNAPTSAPIGVPPVARGDRNNNPGNIEDGRFAQAQPGYSGVEPQGRFATFKTADDGNNAAGNLLGSYGNRGINTVTGVISRWAGSNDANVPNYIAAVSKQLNVDPNAPLDMKDPQVRSALVQAIGQFENGRRGPASSTTAIPQAQPKSPPVQSPAIQAPQDARGNAPTGTDPEVQRQINVLSAIAANPALPKATQEAAKVRLEALQKGAEPTPDQKNYDLARRQGYRGNFQSYQSDMEANKTNASEQAKMYVKRYESIQDEGQKAFRELPQLEVIQKLMADPKFYSGTGEEYNLAFKRILAALPGGDPNAAVPQEAFRKVVSGNILNSLSQLKGLGQIRVAEINLAKEASASTNNTPATNQILVEISKRLHQHSADIADLAQNYNGGRLDSGFDKIVTQYNREHPLFSDAEIQDWKKIISQPGSQQQAQPSATPKEGSIIRNDKTGERMILQGGKWVPFT